MRHLIGLIVAVVTMAVLFVGAGWSTARIVAAHAAGAGLTNTSGQLTLAALLGTGLLIGVLVAVPLLSPLAAGLPALVLLAWSAVHVVNAHLSLRLVPLSGTAEASGFKTLLTSEILGLLGVVMIVPMFIPSRWRRAEQVDEFAPSEEAELVH